MNVALARYLKDFSEPQVAEPAFVADGFDADPFEMPHTDADAVDAETLRQEAFDEGHAAASREWHAHYAAEREALEAEHQQQLAALRAAHEAESAAVIAARILEMAEAVAASVSDQTALVLAPLLSDVIAAKATRDMAELVRQSIFDGTAATILVRGPQHLFEILETELGENASLLRHAETPDLDLTVEIGGTVLVTRISAWAASLKKVLE